MTTVAQPASLPETIPEERVGPLDAIRHTLTLAWRSLVQIRHNPMELTDLSLQPLMFVMLFAYAFGGAIAGSPKAYLLGQQQPSTRHRHHPRTRRGYATRYGGSISVSRPSRRSSGRCRWVGGRGRSSGGSGSGVEAAPLAGRGRRWPGTLRPG
jgi:hypothetical protein